MSATGKRAEKGRAVSRSNLRSSRYPVVVVGAGIAGLTCAYRLLKAGVEVHVFEAASRAGGMIHSERVGGHLFERGPTTVLSTSPRINALIDDAGLRSRALLSAEQAGRRWVWRHDRLHKLPDSPQALFTCGALSLPGRLRLMLEPLISARLKGPPETLEQMGHRRLGKEATAGLLDPFVTGVYAGRIDRLGVDALARLKNWERVHGSFFRAALAQQKAKAEERRRRGESKPSGPPPLISFPNGLAELTDTLAQDLGPRLHLGSRVRSLGRTGAHWRVAVRSAGQDSTAMASAVIIAGSAGATGSLLEPWFGDDVAYLGRVETPHIATVGLGFPRRQVANALDGFGLLVASDSRLSADVLGVLFVSSIFPRRGPENEVTLTTMIGGDRDPGAAEVDDEALVRRSRAALERLLGATGEPTARCVTRWHRGIPQYLPGHLESVERVRQRLSQTVGLYAVGNWCQGAGLEATVAAADEVVARALHTEWTATRPD